MPDYKIKLFVYTAILFQDTASSSSSVAGKVTGIVVIWISAMPRQRKSPEEKLVWKFSFHFPSFYGAVSQKPTSQAKAFDYKSNRPEENSFTWKIQSIIALKLVLIKEFREAGKYSEKQYFTLRVSVEKSSWPNFEERFLWSGNKLKWLVRCLLQWMKFTKFYPKIGRKWTLCWKRRVRSLLSF